jgi:hypothetical protein
LTAGDAPAPRARLAEAAAVAALAALVACVLRGALAGGVLFRRDVHLVWHPQVEAFVRAVAAGAWPVWDPGPVFGHPLMADPSAMVLYPLTWLNLVLRPWTYYTAFAAAHLLWAGLGALRLARHFGLSRPAALLAAALWTLSGPLLSLLDLWHHLAGAAWMPWVLLAADRAGAAPTPARTLCWGAALGAQILAGSADMCAMSGLVALALLVTRADRARPAGPRNRRLLASAAVAGVFALGLSAGLWMTALEVASRSDRASLPAAVRTYWSVHPLSLAQAVLPGGWANLPLRADWRAALFESREPFLGSLYLGLPTVALVGAALAAWRQRTRIVLAAAALTFLLVALGKHAPFYDALVVLLPPLQILRYPVKAMVPAALAWSLLAGFGWDTWTHRGPAVARRRWWLAVVVPVVLVLLAAAGGAAWLAVSPETVGLRLLAPEAPAAAALAPIAAALGVATLLAAAALLLAVLRARSRRAAALTGAVIAGLAVADLLLAHRNVQPVAPRALYTHKPAVVQALEARPHARIYAYDYSAQGALEKLRRHAPFTLERAPQGFSREAALALAMQMHLAPATAGRWALRTGWDIDYRGLYPHDLAQLTLLLRAVEGTPAHTRLLRLGGVSHVVSLHVAGFEDLVLAAEFPGLYSQPTRLLEVPGPLPRTYAVGGVRVGGAMEAIRMVIEGEVDPAREVLLDAGAPVTPAAGFAGTSTVLDESADRVRLRATLSADGHVVLLDAFAPGWRAAVDGEPVPVVRANLAFRAVAVPAGTHLIEYVYRPFWMLAGVSVSAVTLVAGAAAAAVLHRAASRAGAR